MTQFKDMLKCKDCGQLTITVQLFNEKEKSDYICLECEESKNKNRRKRKKNGMEPSLYDRWS